ncbi:MAG TPA: META domain-containing protein [Acidimicrobiia bacterium]|nr:META domain-containing protein [Acidimicrobiia bacterium]
MRRALLIAVALSLILVACADPSEPAGYDPTDSAWLLESGTLRGAAIPVLATHPITLVFEEDGAGGTSACNQYFGDYTISGAAIGFDQLTQTDMACSPDQVMDSEARFLEALSLVDALTVTGDSLTLSGDRVELVFAMGETP